MTRKVAKAKEPTKEAPTTKAVRDRFAGFEAVAAKMKNWRPAAQVLRPVLAVPTCFPQVDLGTRCGGWPIERICTIHGPSNHGKAQPVDEPVLTPQGWVPIGSLREGDWVIGSDGKKVCVIGVFPQGRRPVYEVVFDDGGVTRACAEHLWFTTTKKELNRGRYTRGPRPQRVRTRVREGQGSVKTTATIAASLDEEHTIPFAGSVNTEADERDTALAVDPYVLGLLLGDGSFRGSSLMFTSQDDELHVALRAEAERLGDTLKDATYPDRCRGSRVVRGSQGSRAMPMMRQHLLALDGHRSEKKFVPTEYLWANREARLALLRGLMDTDGSVSSEGTQAQYSTSSPELRDAVVHLVRSLGGRAMAYPHATPNLPSWCVMASFADGTVPFLLRRKASQWKRRKKALRRRIVAVRPAGEAECVCIRVSARDSLYVTRDFVVTHNTAFSHGLGLSFLRAGHFYAFVDAEFTTPEPWLRELMGEQATNPAFVAMRPDSFEQTVDAVRDFLLKIAEAREAGDVEPDTSAIIVIDSARKLIPANLLAKIAKEGASGKKGSVDGMSGRAGQHKAAMMSQWLDEMVPLLAKTRANMTVIAREADDPTADMNDMIYDNAWKIAGSKSLVYEASLVVRVTRDGWVYDPPKGEDRVIVGERHQARIWKTKVGGKEDKHTDCYFHTSNGVDGNVGFDPARDLFDLGRQLGLIDVAGSWFSFGKKKLGQGEGKSVQKLRADEGLRGELQAEVSKIDEGRRSAAPKEDA